MSSSPLGLFDAFGIEVEYMLVDRQTLDIRPRVDDVLAALAGRTVCDVELGPVTWSNELALHVIELKTTDPAIDLGAVPRTFQQAIHALDETLAPLGLQLLPSGMHPWMDPAVETQLWPHEYHEIYETYDRIFNCRAHGWSNVQSVHLNLPFRGDEEFAKLHAAVRVLLPLLPALAASSPVIAGRTSGSLDTRMMFYADHCRAIPSLIGPVIPEPIFDESRYRQEILKPIGREFQTYDPGDLMQVEFLNARGAIARFDRGSIEIRVMDVQEYPGADVALCAAVTAVLRALCHERWSSRQQQMDMPTGSLRRILELTSVRADLAVIDDARLLSVFGIEDSAVSAHAFWARVLDDVRGEEPLLKALFAPLSVILESGTLASRIVTRLGGDTSRRALIDVYRELGDCLRLGRSFEAS